MSSAPASAETLYQPGDWVPFELSPGIVVASYFVSLVGSVTTVELLHRRVTGKSWHNWFQLGTCAVCLGLIGIWCMHYVGNRAIVLGGGDASLQLIYSPGFTALSVFLPVGALFVAFIIADLRHKGTKRLIMSIISSGILTGFAIVGMHYVGNLGVANYHVVFSLTHVGGAIVIACLASLTALSLFFWLQELWLSIFPYRLICALVIAGAVSGMHFEASMGTSYRLNYRVDSAKGRNTNVIIATILCLLTIPICIGIAWTTSRRRMQLADRAQQVLLACARFDSDGRLMVTHEGLLPCQKITIQENQRSFDDAFTTAHPAFQWIFRATHSWTSVDRWAPAMRRHLQSVNFFTLSSSRKASMADPSNFRDAAAADAEDYSVIFREGFCVAASDLASELKEPLHDLGVLYGDIMTTGTLRAADIRLGNSKKSLLRRVPPTHEALIGDLEAGVGTEVFGKGQLLFLVRQSSRHDQAKAFSEGYRFAPVNKIADHLAKSLQVPLPYLMNNLSQLRNLAFAEEQPQPCGVVLACFAIKAGMHKSSWEVLCQRARPDQLPFVQLSATPIEAFETRIVTQLDGLSVSACIASMERRQGSQDRVERMFCAHFKDKLTELSRVVAEPFFRQAILSARGLRIASHDPQSGKRYEYMLIPFHVIPDMHTAMVKSSPTIMYSPLSFFQCRQQVLHKTAHFDRQVHYEFANLFTTAGSTMQAPTPRSRTQLSAFHHFSVFPKSLNMTNVTRSFSMQRTRSSKSIESISSTGSRVMPSGPHRARFPFGGILVSSDLDVETHVIDAPLDPSTADRAASVEPGEIPVATLGTTGHASLADDMQDRPTYVDELFALAVARWRLRS